VTADSGVPAGRDRLAILGGSPTKAEPFPPMFPGGMEIGAEEKAAVLEVLEEKTLFRYYGPAEFQSRVSQLERQFADLFGVRHSLSVSSGTAALITALVALGIGPGDEVIVPAYTFVASPAAVVAARAVPVIVEVDDSLTLDPVDLRARVTPHTRAIMPVHMRGAPCDVESILGIARDYNLKVVEDVAQATGGTYHGRRLGTFGDAGAFSLQLHKIITTGEGGMVVTGDDETFYRARMYHDAAGFWRSEHPGELPIPGVNYRMSEVAGALGLVQLRRLEDLLARMRALKARLMAGLKETLGGLPLRRIHDPEGDTAVCLVFYAPTAALARHVAAALQAENVGASVLYDPGVSNWHVYINWRHILAQKTITDEGCPYRCPHYHGAVAYSPDMCPQTLELLGRAVHIDINPLLTQDDIDQTVEAIEKVARWYGLGG
jgi:8-amino-3,8-dideoxy-alpha-D-manno-octulosonate transaminase